MRLYAYLDALRIEAKVYGDTVDLDLKGLRADLAVALLSALHPAG